MTELMLQDWLELNRDKAPFTFKLVPREHTYGTAMVITTKDGEKEEWLVFGNSIMGSYLTHQPDEPLVDPVTQG